MKNKKFILIIVLVILVPLIFILNNFYIVQVKGDSMLPEYKQGDVLIVKRGNKDIKVGDDVIVDVTDLRISEAFLIKRVTKIIEKEDDLISKYYYKVESLNKNIETLDSNILGTIPKNNIRGRVIK